MSDLPEDDEPAVAPARDVASLSCVGLKIIDALETHYCADCGEPINLWLLNQQRRASTYQRLLSGGLTPPEHAELLRERDRLRAERAEWSRLRAAGKAARKLAALTRSPRIVPGACPACGGGRVARRTGKD